MTEIVQVTPKTKDVAQRLLAAAEEAGVPPQVVKTFDNGFLVPRKVANIFNKAQEPAPKPTSKTKAKVTAAAKTEKEGTGNDD